MDVRAIVHTNLAGLIGFTLALMYALMIESAFTLVCDVSFKTSKSKRSWMSQVILRPTARAQFGLNDTDFLKEFSYV